MKRSGFIILTGMIFSSGKLYGQVSNQMNCTDSTLNFVYAEWVFEIGGGMTYYCGLSGDEEVVKRTYYQISKSCDTLLCRETDSRTGFYSMGQYALTKEDEHLCWKQIGVWYCFDDKNRLIKTENHHYSLLFSKESSPLKVNTKYDDK